MCLLHLVSQRRPLETPHHIHQREEIHLCSIFEQVRISKPGGFLSQSTCLSRLSLQRHVALFKTLQRWKANGVNWTRSSKMAWLNYLSSIIRHSSAIKFLWSVMMETHPEWPPVSSERRVLRLLVCETEFEGRSFAGHSCKLPISRQWGLKISLQSERILLRPTSELIR